jgi:hypothetical protein
MVWIFIACSKEVEIEINLTATGHWKLKNLPKTRDERVKYSAPAILQALGITIWWYNCCPYKWQYIL